jgi:hypothetical protein
MKQEWKTVYVAGTIGGCRPDEVIERFKHIQMRLEALRLKVLNPVRGKAINMFNVDESGTASKYEDNEVVLRDMWDIMQADFVLAFWPKPSIGTAAEMTIAHLIKGIPFIVVTDNPEVYEHAWVKRFAFKILPDIDSAIDYIQDWILGPKY